MTENSTDKIDMSQNLQEGLPPQDALFQAGQFDRALSCCEDNHRGCPQSRPVYQWQSCNKGHPISFDEAILLAKEEMAKALTTSPPIIRKHVEYLNEASGKFVRGMSLLACSINRDNLIDPDAVKLAAAVEILHLATLVHDDVIDDSDMRRGLPSLQKKYGRKTAVICGDYLLCIALKLTSGVCRGRDDQYFDLPDYIAKVCMGELSQHINNGNYNLTAYQYLKIIHRKTAALFEASFFAGATLSGEDAEEIKKYKSLGRYVGVIFQLNDDCMDYEAAGGDAGKPVRHDFARNVVTLPMICALKSIPGFKEKAQGGSLTVAGVDAAVAESGGLSYTKGLAKRYYDKSQVVLKSMKAADYKKRRLYSVLNRSHKALQ